MKNLIIAINNSIVCNLHRTIDMRITIYKFLPSIITKSEIYHMQDY